MPLASPGMSRRERLRLPILQTIVRRTIVTPLLMSVANGDRQQIGTKGIWRGLAPSPCQSWPIATRPCPRGRTRPYVYLSVGARPAPAHHYDGHRLGKGSWRRCPRPPQEDGSGTATTTQRAIEFVQISFAKQMRTFTASPLGRKGFLGVTLGVTKKWFRKIPNENRGFIMQFDSPWPTKFRRPAQAGLRFFIPDFPYVLAHARELL